MRKRWMVLLAAAGVLTLGGTAAPAEKPSEQITAKILEKAQASVKSIEALIQAAKQGDPEVQVELGVMILNEGGDFVEVDAALERLSRAAYVLAYAWTTVALNQGVTSSSTIAGVERDPKGWLRTKMTAEQVAKAERLAAEFERKIRKNRSVERKSP